MSGCGRGRNWRWGTVAEAGTHQLECMVAIASSLQNLSNERLRALCGRHSLAHIRFRQAGPRRGAKASWREPPRRQPGNPAERPNGNHPPRTRRASRCRQQRLDDPWADAPWLRGTASPGIRGDAGRNRGIPREGLRVLGRFRDRWFSGQGHPIVASGADGNTFDDLQMWASGRGIRRVVQGGRRGTEEEAGTTGAKQDSRSF
ncbi:hypothetical protein DFJ74DRAFT_660218 [Hyaloraphidium curvatum]|nr:hypothetical protein DFJ74DRAFT_660218 [Hyaloraphidium curvatum]